MAGQREVKPPKQFMTSEALIEAVRRRPALWDDTKEEYHDQALKKKLWHDIASSFVSGSPNDVKRSWCNLRRALANQRNAYAKKYGISGAKGVKYNPYKYEHLMVFLDGLSGKDEMEGNLDEDSRVDDVSDEVGVGIDNGFSGQAADFSMRQEEEEAESKQTNFFSSTPQVGALKPINFNEQPSPAINKTVSSLKRPPTPPVGKENSPTKKQKQKQNSPTKKKVKSPTKTQKDNSPLKPIQKDVVIETPSQRQARRRKEKQAKVDKERKDVLDAMEKELKEAAEREAEKEKEMKEEKKVKSVKKTTCSVSAFEEAVLAELKKEREDDPVTLFLLSLATDLRSLSKPNLRKLQVSILQLLSDVDNDRDNEGSRKKIGAVTPEELVEVERIVNLPQGTLIRTIMKEEIHVEDMLTLCPKKWLNDVIILTYLYLIKKTVEENGGKSIFVFNTHFLLALMDDEAEDRRALVTRWAGKKNLQDYDMIVVPVFNLRHWTMIIVDLRKATITYCDSYHSKFPAGIKAITKFLEEEYQIKNLLELQATDMPTQSNCHDCGVFAVQYVKYIALGHEVTFNEDDMSHLRHHMILELAHESLRQI